MGSVRQQQGRRLPRRVYWVRRGLVLVVALLTVFGIGKLVGVASQDSPQTDGATVASGSSRDRPAVILGPQLPTTELDPQAKPPLLPPSGECREDEVGVVPRVSQAWAGRPITITLQLNGSQPACTFEVSPESLVVKITSGQQRIWSSQDCRRSVPHAEVVVRSGAPVEVPVTWSGRRSDPACTNQPAWALPGFYHVFAAAYGSSPYDVQFEVTRAPTRVVTRTPKPKPARSAPTTPSTPMTGSGPPLPTAGGPAEVTPRSAPAATPTARSSMTP